MQETEKLLVNRKAIIARLRELDIACPGLVYEGMRRGLTAEALLIAAICAEGGVLRRKTSYRGQEWAELRAKARESDPLFQMLMCLHAVMPGHGDEMPRGVDHYRFKAARSIFFSYRRDLWDDKVEVRFVEDLEAKMDDLLEVVRLGFMDELFCRLSMKRGGETTLAGQNGEFPVLDIGSVVPVKPEEGRWIVGQNFIVPNKPHLQFVRFGTEVSADWVIEHMRERLERRLYDSPDYDETRDQVVRQVYYRTCQMRVGEIVEEPETGYEAQVAFRRWVVDLMLDHRWPARITNHQLVEIANFNRRQIAAAKAISIGELSVNLKFLKSGDTVESWLKAKLGMAENLRQVGDLEKLRFPDVAEAMATKSREEEEARRGDHRLMEEALAKGLTPGALLFKDGDSPDERPCNRSERRVDRGKTNQSNNQSSGCRKATGLASIGELIGE